LRAFERYIELAERTTGGDATRQKGKLGEEEDIVDSETTSVLGSAREVQTTKIVDMIPEMMSMPTEVECSPKQRQNEL